MNAFPAHPSLYQVNTRVWLTGLSEFIGRPVTLDDIPDADLDRLAGMGFDRVWFLSVWQTGPAAQQGRVAMRDGTRISRKRYRTCAKKTSPAPGFAVQSYTVHRDLGGAAALARLREPMRRRGLKLMLDFISNLDVTSL